MEIEIIIPFRMLLALDADGRIKKDAISLFQIRIPRENIKVGLACRLGLELDLECVAIDDGSVFIDRQIFARPDMLQDYGGTKEDFFPTHLVRRRVVMSDLV